MVSAGMLPLIDTRRASPSARAKSWLSSPTLSPNEAVQVCEARSAALPASVGSARPSMSAWERSTGGVSVTRLMSQDRAAMLSGYATAFDDVIAGDVAPFSRLTGTVPAAGTPNADRSRVTFVVLELRLMATSTVSAGSLRTKA